MQDQHYFTDDGEVIQPGDHNSVIKPLSDLEDALNKMTMEDFALFVIAMDKKNKAESLQS